MKDSVSATEVGTGPYITAKGVSQTNLITSVTPEKKVEEEKDEEEDKKKKIEITTTVTTIRHDTKVNSMCFQLSCHIKLHYYSVQNACGHCAYAILKGP